MPTTFKTVYKAFKLAVYDQSRTLFMNYVQVPLGIALLLVPCWAVNLGLKSLSVVFPPSILCMVILFLVLLLFHRVSPNKIFPAICGSLKPACNWSLGTVGIFMTPSFITLPTHTDLSAKQVALICGWFLPPLLVTWIIDIMICKMIARALPFPEEDVYGSEHLELPHGGLGLDDMRRRPSSRILRSSRPHPPLPEDERWVKTPEPEEGIMESNLPILNVAIDTNSFLSSDSQQRARPSKAPQGFKEANPALDLLREWTQETQVTQLSDMSCVGREPLKSASMSVIQGRNLYDQLNRSPMQTGTIGENSVMDTNEQDFDDEPVQLDKKIHTKMEAEGDFEFPKSNDDQVSVKSSQGKRSAFEDNDGPVENSVNLVGLNPNQNEDDLSGDNKGEPHEKQTSHRTQNKSSMTTTAHTSSLRQRKRTVPNDAIPTGKLREIFEDDFEVRHSKSRSWELRSPYMREESTSHPQIRINTLKPHPMCISKHPTSQSRTRSWSLAASEPPLRRHLTRPGDKLTLGPTLTKGTSSTDGSEHLKESRIQTTETGKSEGNQDPSTHGSSSEICEEFSNSLEETHRIPSTEPINSTQDSWVVNRDLPQGTYSSTEDPPWVIGPRNNLIPFPTLDSNTRILNNASDHNRHSTPASTINGKSVTSGETMVDIHIIPVPISTPNPSPVAELSRKLARLLDLIIYVIITIIGVVLFYTPGGQERSQVLFIGAISLVWLFSRRIIPHTWTKILHPTLTTSLLAAVSIMGLGALKGLSVKDTLEKFSHERTYLDFFDPVDKRPPEVLGAGDILESILDAGTVGLAFTIFDYRRDLYNNFIRVFLVIVPNCSLSLLVWPFMARHLNVLPSQAIDFAGRSMSAPLALELLKAVGGNRNLGVVLVYMTGITVTLLRTPIFRLFKIRTASLKTHEDYFTMGVTVGAVGGVIGTSSLLKRHRRAAGTATVALLMYAIIMLCLVAVRPVARFVGDIAGGPGSEGGD